MVNNSKRITIVRDADLGKNVSISKVKCVFFDMFRKMTLFMEKVVSPQNGLLVFFGTKTDS